VGWHEYKGHCFQHTVIACYGTTVHGDYVLRIDQYALSLLFRVAVGQCYQSHTHSYALISVGLFDLGLKICFWRGRGFAAKDSGPLNTPQGA
jgi:hypothetical protein